MQYKDQESRQTWANGVYGTGPMRHRKNYGWLLAILLVVIIFLSGLVSLLSIMNIRMFQKLKEKREEELPISFCAEASESVESTTLPESTRSLPEKATIDLQTSRESVENVPQEGGLSLQEIYNRNISSVVSITSNFSGGSATGTGVIFSENGYIVTNFHVVENAREIIIQLTDDRVLPGTLLAYDGASDLAVVCIEADDLQPAEFGDSDMLQVGDCVVAIGDPLGSSLRGTMTNGIVSAINRGLQLNGMVMNLIQTNAALNSGNSGGPLINCYGQVVGINTMKIGAFTDNAGVEGIGFAIPSATVKEIVDELVQNGYVTGRPTLGIYGERLSSFYQRYYHMPAGLFITQVTPGSASEEVGIVPGDILVSVGDKKITSFVELKSALYAYDVGQNVPVVIYRDGFLSTYIVELDEAKQ